MAEILHHPGCIKPCKEWVFTISTGAGFQPSTVVRKCACCVSRRAFALSRSAASDRKHKAAASPSAIPSVPAISNTPNCLNLLLLRIQLSTHFLAMWCNVRIQTCKKTEGCASYFVDSNSAHLALLHCCSASTRSSIKKRDDTLPWANLDFSVPILDREQIHKFRGGMVHWVSHHVSGREHTPAGGHVSLSSGSGTFSGSLSRVATFGTNGICVRVCGWSWQQWSCNLKNGSTHQPLLSDVRFSYVHSWRCASSQTNTSSRLTDSKLGSAIQPRKNVQICQNNVISLACSSSFVLSAARLSYSWQNC